MSRQRSSRRLVYTTIWMVLLPSMFNSTMAEIVPREDALRVAANLTTEFISQGILTTEATASLSFIYGTAANPELYIINSGNSGFFIISGESEVYPVLGWSLHGNYDQRAVPPALSEWLEGYCAQIAYIRAEGLTGDNRISETWSRYLMSPGDFTPVMQTESQPVGPLLSCEWNQNNYYNAMCPTDPDGPGGRALAGCVATAMGQVMYYYRHPQTGVGTSTHYHPDYGQMSVNHGNTTYKWNEMGDLANSKSHLAIAELLYHLGVAVQMNYGPNASGAYSSNAADALIDHFGYDQSLTLEYKNNHTETAWATLLRNNLDAGHPMYYHGYGSGGHAFNVDGYQNNTHFHFNWGWSGAYNGYFYLSSLNPGSNNFTSGQGAIVNFKPAASGYPLNCTVNQTATSLEGSLEDGSGPIADYQPNLNCSYLIQPSGLVSRIEIQFQRFATQAGVDKVYIHDGVDQNAPLLATISGDTIFPMIITTGSAAFVRFVTDGSVNDGGWYLTYEAFRPVFCPNLQTFTSTSGIFDDGSGPNIPYNNNTNCKYLIQTGSQLPVMATFNYFSLEDGKDFLRVYDPTTIPSTLLVQLTGSTIPLPVTGPKGQLMFVFYSDSDNPDIGWEVSYSTLAGTPELSAQGATIYPNPAHGSVTLRFQQPQSEVCGYLHDLSGRLIRTFHITTDEQLEFEADLGGIAPGLYLLTTGNNNSQLPSRLMIR